MTMKNLEGRQPKNIEDVRDRFMDFIGNPLNGLLGCLDSLQHEELSSERRERLLANVQDIWNDLFARLKTFRNSGFRPSGRIDIEHIDNLLTFFDKNPLQAGIVEELNGTYSLMVDKS